MFDFMSTIWYNMCYVEKSTINIVGITLKEDTIIFKKLRQRITEHKNDFFEAKAETEVRVVNWFNFYLITAIELLFAIVGLILTVCNLPIIAIVLLILTFIWYLFMINTKMFRMTGKLSYRLLFYLFGRYGKVVSKKDWKNIKKHCKKFYKEAFSKKSLGHCYYYSWGIAEFLQDAQLMYCSIMLKDGPSMHSVIVKNNCVYDTNQKRHFNYDEYIELYEAKVYKMFSREEYCKKSFFEDIRKDLVEWCTKNNVYCDPQ